MEICWCVHLFSRDISLAFKVEDRDDENDIGRLTINDGEELGPVVLSCASSAELVLLLGTAVQLLTNTLTLERCVTFRFQEIAHGAVKAWVTLGTRPPIGPLFPSEAIAETFGATLGMAIGLLQQAPNVPRSSSVTPMRP